MLSKSEVVIPLWMDIRKIDIKENCCPIRILIPIWIYIINNQKIYTK